MSIRFRRGPVVALMLSAMLAAGAGSASARSSAPAAVAGTSPAVSTALPGVALPPTVAQRPGVRASAAASPAPSSADGTPLAQIIADRSGTNCASYNAAGDHGSVGVGIAFDGTDLLVSCYSDNTITAVRTSDGSQVAVHHITNASSLGALAYDRGRGVVWACSGFSEVGTVDLATDVFTPVFSSNGCFDGLAYDGDDDTLWSSGDVAGTFQHTSIDGTLLASFTANLGSCGNSGLAIGGDLLYLANNGCSEIYRADKTSPESTTYFAGFPRRIEDMECDNVTFPSDDAMWAIDAYDNVLNAFAITQNTCGFGGGQPEGPYGDPTCSDGVDNDRDGLVDSADPDCAPPPVEICDNGRDDDGDGLVDGADPDCPAPPDPCTAAAGDPGLLTDDTLGQTLFDRGLSALAPLVGNPDHAGPISNPLHDGGDGSGVEVLTDELSCAVSLVGPDGDAL